MSQHTITPAINLHEEIPTEMSAEEFQKRLFVWFEERGLLSELRAHLRKQMIGALKDTVLTQLKQTISPKVQALNLLVGEYLLSHNYHYSLSVFSTEVPLANMLPEIPLCLNPTDKTNKSKEWKFLEKDTWDILETLGIARDSNIGQSIYNCYYEGEPQPLLRCIIKFTNASVGIDIGNVCTTYEAWLKGIGEVLHANNVSTQKIKDILSTIIGLVEVERKRIGKELQEEYTKLLKEVAEEQKNTAKGESCTKEAQEYEVKILKHQQLLQTRYHQLIKREREVHKKEHQLQQGQEYMEAQHRHLQSGFDSLYREQMTAKQLQKQLEQEIREKQLTAKSDAVFLENLQKECKDMKNHIIDTQEALLNVSGEEQPQTKQDLITQLQIENKALQTISVEQRARIDELTERLALLLRDLESTQAAVHILTNNNQVGVLTAPPLLAPPSLTLGTRKAFVNGGGEDGARPVPPPPREYKNLPNSRDLKRRQVTRRTSQLNWSTSDESAPTNNILQEARDRLRRLEEESEQVDRHYQQFKLKRAQEGNLFKRHPRQTTWMSDLNKENVDELGPIPCTSAQLTSANHLMEYTPLQDTPQDKCDNLSEHYFSESSLNPRPRPSAATKLLENIACKDTNASATSSGVDELLAGDISNVSVSPLESTDKSESLRSTLKD